MAAKTIMVNKIFFSKEEDSFLLTIVPAFAPAKDPTIVNSAI